MSNFTETFVIREISKLSIISAYVSSFKFYYYFFPFGCGFFAFLSYFFYFFVGYDFSGTAFYSS